MLNHYSSCHVLIVEDDPSLSAMLTAVLEANSYTVGRTDSAREALALAREQHPSIVVCDVHLPEGDGRSLLRDIRADPTLSAVQFVLMTGDGRSASQRVGMNLGANDYLAKPFSVEEFAACIEARRRQAMSWQRIEQRGMQRMKNTISAVLPHEFFTPLAGIMGLSDLLREDVDNTSPEILREQLNDIHECARRLHHALENYLMILRLSDEPPQVGREPRQTPLSDLLPVFASVASEIAGRYQRSGDLHIDCASSGAQKWLALDGHELSKIVTELIDNAFKFSEPGKPVVAHLEEAGDTLRLTVADQGRGMSAGEIAQIGAFRQFNRHRFEQQGLGLGLTLAQYLIEHSGGQFLITSESGRGSTVFAHWDLMQSDCC